MLRNFIFQVIMQAKIWIHKRSYSMQMFQGYQDGIISWSIKSSKKKQNKSKVNISLSSSEQGKKVKSAWKKEFFKKDVHSK